MNRLLRTVLTAALLLVLTVSCAGAGGYSHTRDGSVIGANIGWGWTKLNFTAGSESTPESGETETQDAFGFALRYGFAPNDSFMYGASVGGWRKSFDINSILLYYVNVAGTWFPGGGGFFVRGAVGYGVLDVTVRPTVVGLNVVSFQNGGLNLAAGTGLEFRLQPELALGVAFDANWISVGDVADLREVSAINYMATLQIAYYMF